MELLIIVAGHSYQHPDREANASKYRPGDVVAAVPNGHNWRPGELENPNWRIVRVPGLRKVEADALVASELPEVFAPNQLLRKRQFIIDIEQLDIVSGGELLSARKANQRGVVDCVVTVEMLRSCRSLKKRLTDPRIIGPRTGVIG